jgi:thiamine-phosphate pyrophosphorylase
MAWSSVWKRFCDRGMIGGGENLMLRARLRLMLVTDRRIARVPLAAAVARAVAGGVTAVMVREAGLGARELLELTEAIRDAGRDADLTVVVNDRIDVAKAAGISGVHLKRTSLPVAAARAMLGDGALVGVSAHLPAEVHEAFEEGADYVIFGPLFATPSKAGILDPRGPEAARVVAAAAAGPVVAIGGIQPENATSIRPPIAGVAAIRALLDTSDPEDAARRLRAATEALA